MKRKHSLNNLIFLMIVFLLVLIYLFLPKSRPVYEFQSRFVVHTKGLANATVNLTVFSDYQCFRSKVFWVEIEPKLEKEYIDTGRVQLIYKHFPKTYYNRSFDAAIAAECAADQEKFWEYHNLLFEKLIEIGNNTCGSGIGLSPNDLKEYARQLGLNAGLFDACLDSNATYERVSMDIRYGKEKGLLVSGVARINDDYWIPIDKPYDYFKEAIENATKS